MLTMPIFAVSDVMMFSENCCGTDRHGVSGEVGSGAAELISCLLLLVFRVRSPHLDGRIRAGKFYIRAIRTLITIME